MDATSTATTLSTRTPARPSGVAPEPTPANLPWPATLPEHQQLRGRDRWMLGELATISQPDGFDPDTGEPVARTTAVVAAPYPEFRAVVRLPKTTPFRDVIGAAQALSAGGERDARFGDAQAVLQSEAGDWYITAAGHEQGGDHVEPLPITWHEEGTVLRRQRDLAAIVDVRHWVNFTETRPGPRDRSA